MKKICLVLIVFSIAAVPIAKAQFGLFSMPVFDLTNYLNALNELAQLEQQLNQLVQTYDQLVLEYKQMKWMAQILPGLDTYMYIAAPWQLSASANTYGSTGAWTSAVDSGSSPIDGYNQAVDPLGVYGPAFAEIPADQIERVKSNYASVELADAANIHSLAVLGSLRGKAAEAEQSIGSLESASLWEDPDFNTEIAVLNKINAADVMGLRTSQETNQLLVSLLEQTVTESKARRDAEAEAIDNDIAFRQNATAAGMSGVSGTTQAITSFSMP
jgi:hypothetical protein